jgi:hypothetical protein
MEIDMNVLGAIKVRRHITIMDKITVLDKGIHILDLDQEFKKNMRAHKHGHRK